MDLWPSTWKQVIEVNSKLFHESVDYGYSDFKFCCMLLFHCIMGPWNIYFVARQHIKRNICFLFCCHSNYKLFNIQIFILFPTLNKWRCLCPNFPFKFPVLRKYINRYYDSNVVCIMVKSSGFFHFRDCCPAQNNAKYSHATTLRVLGHKCLFYWLMSTFVDMTGVWLGSCNRCAYSYKSTHSRSR